MHEQRLRELSALSDGFSDEVDADAADAQKCAEYYGSYRGLEEDRADEERWLDSWSAYFRSSRKAA